MDGENATTVAERLARLTGYAPVYARFLKNHAAHRTWLEDPINTERSFSQAEFQNIWNHAFYAEQLACDPLLATLREFRRLMSARIAYREVNQIGTVQQSLTELTWLAEFCLSKVVSACESVLQERFGVPWDDENDAPARFCILGLGKFGGGELNFCSDLDLIYTSDGAGTCRKGNRQTRTANEEYFNRLGRELTSKLQQRTADGFLYNIDLRLRPEGDGSPLVRSLTAMENYYYVAGQTWERIALMKARPVAGDLNLGEEILERLNPFRYPRARPPFLLRSIAGVKLRIERQSAADSNALARNLKNGPGGIREIEFFLQALQMLNGGQNPFLQVPGTLEALEKLERYEFVDSSKAAFLRGAYCALRRIENLVQIPEESQVHDLPSTPAALDHLAIIAGHPERAEFETWLSGIRHAVNENYRELFNESESESESEIQDWTLMLGGRAPSAMICRHFEKWFGEASLAQAPDKIRQFVLGDVHNVLTREQVTLFLNLAESFDDLLPRLATPLETLTAVSTFGRAYGVPKQFFKACSQSPRMFEALCLLFDQSKFVHQLLSRHPEIIEEVLGPMFGRDKSVQVHREEISQLPSGDGDEFARWLWLYAKAEQVRLTIRDLLGEMRQEAVCLALSNLADATVAEALRVIEAEDSLAIVSLGKHGSRELTFGSDLDLLILSLDSNNPAHLKKAQLFLRLLGYKQSLGPIFEIDCRLRPHGKDGPLFVTINALQRYHQGGGGQFWERLALVRSRGIAGDIRLLNAFESEVAEIVYERGATEEELDELGQMRARIEKEKGDPDHPERTFKAGRGGLVDIEFLCQRYQLTLGGEAPELRGANTAQALQMLCNMGVLSSETTQRLLANHAFLRRVEYTLRRYDNTAAAVLDVEIYPQLAHWLGLESGSAVEQNMRSVMQEVRDTVRSVIDIPSFPA